MIDAKVARILRLIELRQGEALSAQRALADATRASAAAEQRRANAVRTWEAKAAELVELRGVASGDVAVAAAYLRTLHARIEAADAELSSARGAEAAHRAATLEARAVVRRLEAWRDRVAEESLAEAARLERRADDEHAARSSRRPA